MDVRLDLVVGLLALLVAGYGLISVRLTRWSVSAAFAFLVIGAVTGIVGQDLFGEALPSTDTLGVLAEVTLALVLFSAASTVRLKRLELDSAYVLRLLGVGLPLTIALGTVLALGLFPGISFGLALLLGTILAPTDADLGHQVISDSSVPARIRRVLNVESGLNDGIAAPVVTVGIVLATAADVGDVHPAIEAARELALALLVGVAVGGVGRWRLLHADLHRTASSSSRQLAALALAVGAYFIAAGLDASGFIAAFAAGLVFGVGHKDHVSSAVAFTEAQSVLLSIVVWLVFGLIVVSEHVLGVTDPMVIVYAVLALTVARMLPVALALLGVGFDRVTVAFIGWFGPRGLASVVFVLLALEELERVGVPSDPLGPVVAWTVVLSVVLHGFSAGRLAAWYGRRAQALPPDAPELVGESEPHRSGWTFHEGHRGSP